MRNAFLVAVLIFCAKQDFAQMYFQYLTYDSARSLILNARNSEEKFYGYFSMDRHYYTTGLYDSSRNTQRVMYAIAKALKSDSLLASTHHAIGNMLVQKSDYNFALSSYFKSLEYAKDEYRKSRTYAAAGYVYLLKGNNELGYQYVKKADSLNNSVYIKKAINILSGLAFNNFKKPDSALIFLQLAEADIYVILDPTMTAVLLGQFSRSYEMKGDTDLADLYYQKTLAFCKKENLLPSYIRNGNRYCSYLLRRGDYQKGESLAMEMLLLARQTISNDGISNAAESLKEIYNHSKNHDSALFYAEMQIAYKDSFSNQERDAEFQNITFAQQLKDIDEESKNKEEAEQRKENIQYSLIALGIMGFIISFLLVSRRVITSEKVIRLLGLVAFLVLLEFLNLLLHPFLERITQQNAILMLLAFVCIGGLLVPVYHKFEKGATHKIIEKNKQIRLAVAKRAIEQLEILRQ